LMPLGKGRKHPPQRGFASALSVDAIVLVARLSLVIRESYHGRAA
jgi:hypothetical protein